VCVDDYDKGIIVQLPLPEHINPQTVHVSCTCTLVEPLETVVLTARTRVLGTTQAIGAIGAAKDVDGLHPTNVGASVLGMYAPLSLDLTALVLLACCRMRDD
jgi:5,10-methylene-tetrahydrofolate dehydrogenase/methenyl tetrahydrofolate cyclohydrolase